MTADAFEGLVLEAVLLQAAEGLADLFDERALAAEVDRTLAIAVAVGEAVIGAVGLRAATAMRGYDASLPHEEFRAGGQEGECGMNLLVNNWAIFQFWLLDQTARFAGCRRSRGNAACILLCADRALCDGSCLEQEMGQGGILADGPTGPNSKAQGNRPGEAIHPHDCPRSNGPLPFNPKRNVHRIRSRGVPASSDIPLGTSSSGDVPLGCRYTTSPVRCSTG